MRNLGSGRWGRMGLRVRRRSRLLTDVRLECTCSRFVLLVSSSCKIQSSLFSIIWPFSDHVTLPKGDDGRAVAKLFASTPCQQRTSPCSASPAWTLNPKHYISLGSTTPPPTQNATNRPRHSSRNSDRNSGFLGREKLGFIVLREFLSMYSP
jgi:hypothetical protein